MIDTHSHLLPGLDHGCPDLQTSLRMIRAACAAGTTTIVCTPHLYDWDPSFLDEAHEVHTRVRRVVADEGMRVRLLLGFEVDAAVVAEADEGMMARLAISDPISGEEPVTSDVPSGSPASDPTPQQDGDGGRAVPSDLFAGEPRPVGTLGWKGALLIETPFHGWPPYLQEIILRVKTAGYTPILAHPERNERIQRTPELLDICLRAGAVAQGTAGSLTGPFRRGSMGTFLDLLTRGSLSLLASDGHAQVDYTWSLEPLLTELRKKAPLEYLQTLVRTNPELVLSGGRPLPVIPEARSAGRPRRRR